MINNNQLDKNFFNYACTKCGVCKAIYSKNFIVKDNNFKLAKNLSKSELVNFNKFCPGVGFSYINKPFTKSSNLIGPFTNSYVGFSRNSLIRKNSASGGVITEILIYLIKTKKINYVLMPIQSENYTNLPEYKLTNDLNEIKNNSQSIYTKIPVKNLHINKSNKIAFVGLPDQISSIKRLVKNRLIKKNFKYFIGPMVGINMDNNSIDGIKLSFNIKRSAKIKKLKWREGKWPGFLSIKFEGYKKIKLKKFYYNFLLPFYCSHESLLSADFTNEDADISVGDAWSPKFENSNEGGVSLIWSKNTKGDKLLNIIAKKKKISLEKIHYNDAIKMHSHMLDFKKRGSQYRRNLYKLFNIPVPNHKLKKVKFSIIRYFIEATILIIIMLMRSKLGKLLLFIVPPNFLGVIFEKLRLFWKKITKKTKREKLEDY